MKRLFYENPAVIGGTVKVESIYPHVIGNASLSYTTSDEKWKVTAWVKNFTDEEYRLYNLDIGVLDLFIGPGFGFSQSVYAPPITGGVNASYNW